eukprot:4740923-Pleurochrysis_carterae.AAC.1
MSTSAHVHVRGLFKKLSCTLAEELRTCGYALAHVEVVPPHLGASVDPLNPAAFVFVARSGFCWAGRLMILGALHVPV